VQSQGSSWAVCGEHCGPGAVSSFKHSVLPLLFINETMIHTDLQLRAITLDPFLLAVPTHSNYPPLQLKA
jgi:hypothetical protein